jgi:nicotinamidase-related amidase
MRAAVSAARVQKRQSFARGPGAAKGTPISFRRNIVIHEQWAQSGIANTDLDCQLKQHRI